MSEPNITQTNNQPGATGDAGEKAFTPIQTQEELNKVISNRLKRQSREFEARTAELSDKAAKWDEWQEQNKTDLQKAEERVAALERQVSEYTQRETRNTWLTEVADELGIPRDALSCVSGSTKEEISANAERLKPFISAQKENPAPYVGSDGFAPSGNAGRTTAQQFASAIEGLI